MKKMIFSLALLISSSALANLTCNVEKFVQDVGMKSIQTFSAESEPSGIYSIASHFREYQIAVTAQRNLGLTTMHISSTKKPSDQRTWIRDDGQPMQSELGMDLTEVTLHCIVN
jgi:hypothetical protein